MKVSTKLNVPIAFFAAGIALTIAVLIAWHFFELYPRPRSVPPSAEARANRYLALDRWLTSMGRTVRIRNSGDYSLIVSAEENNVLIHTSLFHWRNGDAELLSQWVTDGGTLYLVVDDETTDAVNTVLSIFGVAAETRGEKPYPIPHDIPNFSDAVSFTIAQLGNDTESFTLADEEGTICLVDMPYGKGRFIVSGMPVFLWSSNLKKELNARLAWAIFAAHTANEHDTGSWLFVRGKAKISGLIGSLFQRGNFTVLIISALILIIIGFWNGIPTFGLVQDSAKMPGKSLRERFQAEGRFLKRHNALSLYTDVYLKAIRQKARQKGLTTDDEIIPWAIDILRKAGFKRERDLFSSALRKESIPYRQFPAMIRIFQTILERI